MQFPSVWQLPPVIQAMGWDWQPSPIGWVGTDEHGDKWLTKLRGSFRAYRKLVFERIVRRLGWSCQSSAFAFLPNDSLPLQEGPDAENIQLVSWLLPEHIGGPCGPNCPAHLLKEGWDASGQDPIEVLQQSALREYIAYPLRWILACLFGGEVAGKLITTDHQVVMIGGELMFGYRPSDPRGTRWWEDSPLGRRLIQQACAAVGSLTDADLEECLEIPEGIQVDLRWDIRALVYEARNEALVWSLILAGEIDVTAPRDRRQDATVD